MLTTGHTLTIDKLRAGLHQFRRGLREDERERRVVSTGIPALDELLPESGLRRGALNEWIGAEVGCGVLSLAMRVAAAAQSDGPLIIVDTEKTLYPPAIQATGVSLTESIVVRPASLTEALWAVEQSLRCVGIGGVLFPVDQLRTQDFRRLQLAAESGTAVGLLVRPSGSQRQPGWADVRLLVSPRPARPNSFCRRMAVQCIYAKGSLTDRTIELEMCDETGAVRLASGLTDAEAV